MKLTQPQKSDLIRVVGIYKETVGSRDWPGGKSVRLRTGKCLEKLGLVINCKSNVNRYNHYIPTELGLKTIEEIER